MKKEFLPNTNNMKVETIKLVDWNQPEVGLIVAENEEWLLMKHIPVDYFVDGYKLYNKTFISQRHHTVEEQKIEYVLNLKGCQPCLPTDFTFADSVGLLLWVEARYGLFEFQDDEESMLVYGKMKKTFPEYFLIDFINSDGVVDHFYDYPFKRDQVRIITFGTDYHQSIRLLWLDNQKISKN